MAWLAAIPAVCPRSFAERKLTFRARAPGRSDGDDSLAGGVAGGDVADGVGGGQRVGAADHRGEGAGFASWVSVRRSVAFCRAMKLRSRWRVSRERSGTLACRAMPVSTGRS